MCSTQHIARLPQFANDAWKRTCKHKVMQATTKNTFPISELSLPKRVGFPAKNLATQKLTTKQATKLQQKNPPLPRGILHCHPPTKCQKSPGAHTHKHTRSIGPLEWMDGWPAKPAGWVGFSTESKSPQPGTRGIARSL